MLRAARSCSHLTTSRLSRWMTTRSSRWGDGIFSPRDLADKDWLAAPDPSCPGQAFEVRSLSIGLAQGSESSL